MSICEQLINKTMDRDDLDTDKCIAIIRELNDLMMSLNERRLLYSSWGGLLDRDEGELGRLNRGYGYLPHPLSYDDSKIPWFLYWEIAWVYLYSGVTEGSTVLDMGGCSSLFSYFLAHKGCTVHAVDLQPDLVRNAKVVADQMGWKMYPQQINMVDMAFEDGYFDYVFSICVFEHIPFRERLRIMKKVSRALKAGGRFCITIDYKNPDLAMTINSPEDVEANFIEPSGFSIIGNKRFCDNGKRYLFHPWFHRRSEVLKRVCARELPVTALFKRSLANYTFGALFCQKDNQKA